MISALIRQPAFAAALILSTLGAAPALAAPTVGPSDNSFYTPPSPLPAGTHGDLIWYRPATVNLGTGAPAVKAWNVLYRSTDALGVDDVVTGTVLVPTAAYKGLGARPIVSYAVGTHGLAQSCAPSFQMAGGTDYENANYAAALNAGYAVLVTDYQGYTNAGLPTYLVGASQGHAVLDIVQAAAQIPSSGVSATAKTAIWGYSQGGQTAAWAGELQASYAPSLNLVGVAAGGVPADFDKSAANLDGSTGEGFLLAGVVGIGNQYHIPVASLTNPTGKAAIAQIKTQCVFETVFTYMNHKFSEYSLGNLSLPDIEAGIPSIAADVQAQNLGNNKIPVPLYQYHGLADEFIPLDQDIALKQKYCSLYGNVTFATYPGEHIATQFQAAPTVLSWLGDRFAGKLTLGNCLELAPQPKSTANPGGGDFIVSLKSWQLGGTVSLKTLGQTITLPSGATFTADTNLSQKTLTGSLSIPSFLAHLSVVGLPADVKLTIAPVGATTGTATLDYAGQLHVHGHALANITVVSAGESILQIPLGCQTSSPVDFPIDFDGPVSSLGNGNLKFSGTTTFPSLSGCGVFGPLLSAVMSGPGQGFTYVVTPPAPVNW